MHFKFLYLLSFSLAFLAKGIAHDDSYEEEMDPFLVVEDEYVNEDALDEDEYLSDAQPSPSRMNSRYSSDPSDECLSHFHRMHLGVRHNEARGIGYNDGYTTLEAFGIYDGCSKYFMPFIDLRGHVFNNGKLAGNAGIGERTLIPSINHTFGSFLYYDVRRVGHGLTVNQLSPGLELVGKRMEYRINGYFPVGKDKSRQYSYEFNKFKGNNIILKSKQYHAMRGGDAEIGVHLTQSTKYDLYAAAGPYYLHSPHANSWGGRTRLLGRFKEYFSLEAAYSYDHLFRSVIEGSVALTLPLGCKLKRTGDGCPQGNDLLLSRASFAPSRFEIPVVKRTHPKEKAIDPATGKPWVVWFVNNTSSSAGTFQSPFPTLLQAQNASSPNDMIYVFPGDGTTTGMDMGITLQDGQSFFGSGIKQQFATTKGTQTIPAMSSSFPSISNTANVVTLGNGNVVSGLNIIGIGPTANGIVGGSIVAGVSIPITGATIANNVITFLSASGNGNIGINITGNGSFSIYNNQISSSNSIPIGIALVNQGTANGFINNNSISGSNTSIRLFAIGPVASGNYNFTIQENALTGFGKTGGFGISVQLPLASQVSIIGNTLQTNLNAGAGINVTDLTGINSTTSGAVVINNNLVTLTSTSNSFGIQVAAGTGAGSIVNANVTNNSVNTATVGAFPTSAAFSFSSTGTSSICLSLDNNTATNPPTSTGFGFNTAGSGVINIDSTVGDIGGTVSTVGNGVFFVAPGTCGD